MDLLTRTGVTLAGYGAAAVLLWLLVDAKSEIKAEVERCNTEKLAAVQEATEALRRAQNDALTARIAELESIALRETNARRIAQKAALEAQNRPERVRTVIKEVASANACIDTTVPDAVLDELR